MDSKGFESLWKNKKIKANKNCLGQIHGMIVSYEVILGQIRNKIHVNGATV